MDIENRLVAASGGGEGVDRMGEGDQRCKLPVIKQ